MFTDLEGFRRTVETKKRLELKNQTVHLRQVNPVLLGLPEALLESFTALVENFDPHGVSNQDIASINQLLNCFTQVLERRISDSQSHKDFREYIRNRLTIRLARLQLDRRSIANRANRQ